MGKSKKKISVGEMVRPQVFKDLEKLTAKELNELVRDSIYSSILLDVRKMVLGNELKRRGLPMPNLELVRMIGEVVATHISNDDDLFNLNKSVE